MSISTLRDGIRNQIRDVSGITGYDVLSESLDDPAAVVFPVTLERMTGGAGTFSYQFMVEVYVPLALGLENAQDVLDNFIDPKHAKSLESAIEADRTLGGIAQSASVGGFTNYRYWSRVSDSKATHLTARIPVEVYA